MFAILASYYYVIVTSIIHPFHVSVCEIYHNDKTNALEISMKIFTDDLELAIQKDTNIEFKLVDQPADQVEKSSIEKYILNKFSIVIDEKDVHLNFLGFEFDQDAVLCYFEGKKIKKIRNVEIRNSIITEVFDDQINLSHFQYHDEMKSLRTTKINQNGIIDTSSW